jgi:hypothetical protein
MQLRHLQNVLPPTEGMSKVTSICWCVCNQLPLAVCRQLTAIETAIPSTSTTRRAAHSCPAGEQTAGHVEAD